MFKVVAYPECMERYLDQSYCGLSEAAKTEERFSHAIGSYYIRTLANSE